MTKKELGVLVLCLLTGVAYSMLAGLDCGTDTESATSLQRLGVLAFVSILGVGFYFTALYPRKLSSTQGRLIIRVVPDVVSVNLIRLIGVVGSAGSVWIGASVVLC
jgi:hypothetical protein